MDTVIDTRKKTKFYGQGRSEEMTLKCNDFYKLHNSDKEFVTEFDIFWKKINWEQSVDKSWSDHQVEFMDQWKGLP